MTTPIKDPYVGQTNGASVKVTVFLEWIWRFLSLIALPVMIYMFVQISYIQTTLAGIQVKLITLEQRTQQIPPVDYRAYIDAKFNAVDEQLHTISDDLKSHMRQQ